MSRSRRRGSKDLPEEEPLVDDHDPSSSAVPENSALESTTQDPNPEISEQVSVPVDAATSSSPLAVSPSRSKEPPEENTQELLEENTLASSSPAKRTRRRGSKDLPEEEDDPTATLLPPGPPVLESQAASSSPPRYSESDLEWTPPLSHPAHSSAATELGQPEQPNLLPEGKEGEQELSDELVVDEKLRQTALDSGFDQPPDLLNADREVEPPLQLLDWPPSPATETLEDNDLPMLMDLPPAHEELEVQSPPDSAEERKSVLSKFLKKNQTQSQSKLGAIAGIPRSTSPGGLSPNNQLEDDRDEDDESLAGDDNFFRNRNDQLFPHSTSNSLSDDLSDVESDAGASRLPPARTRIMNLKWKNEDDELAQMVEINNCSMLCSICLAITWVFGAAATLLALTWHYVWVEAKHLTEDAARAAVHHGCLHSSEVLRSAVILMRTLDMGFRMGTIVSMWSNVSSPSTIVSNSSNYSSHQSSANSSNHSSSYTFDYKGFNSAVEPFFKVLPSLREVELVDTPEQAVPGVAPGSIVAARSALGGVEIRSDRGDCTAVLGGRGCTLEPQLASGTAWYEECLTRYPHRWSPMPLSGMWHGPEFSRDLPHEAICDELCWSPIFSLTSRISGDIDPRIASSALANDAFYDYRSYVARVTMEAKVFVEILRTVQVQLRGEAIICTFDGTIVAAVDMAKAQAADENSGAVRMVKIWDFPADWSSIVDEGMLSSGNGDTVLHSRYLVSAWKLESPFEPNISDVMDALGDELRLVVAIHQDAFADAMINSMRFWFIVVSALPVVFVVVMVVANLFSRYCLSNKMQQSDLTYEEMQRMARSRTQVARTTTASKATSRAWTKQGSTHSNKFGITGTNRSKAQSSAWLRGRSQRSFKAKHSLPSTASRFSGKSAAFSKASSLATSMPSMQALTDRNAKAR